MSILRPLSLHKADAIKIGVHKLENFERVGAKNEVLALNLENGETLFISDRATPPNPGLAPHNYQFFYDEELTDALPFTLTVRLFQMQEIDY